MKTHNFNERSNIHVIAGIFIAIFIASSVLLFNQISSKAIEEENVKRLTTDLETKDSTLSKGNMQLDKLRNKNKGTVSFMRRVGGYKKISENMLANRNEKIKALIDLLVKEHNLTLTSLTPLDPSSKRLGNYDYDGQIFNISGFGEYKDIALFMSSLENKIPLMETLTFSLDKSSNENPKQLNVSVSIFVISDIEQARTRAKEIRI